MKTTYVFTDGRTDEETVAGIQWNHTQPQKKNEILLFATTRMDLKGIR